VGRLSAQSSQQPSSYRKSKVIPILLVAVLVIGFAIGGVAGYFARNVADSNDSKANSVADLQASSSTFMHNLMSKLADVSGQKALKVTNAGFDSLSSIFRTAASAVDFYNQYNGLCSPSAISAFNRTSTITYDPKLKGNHTLACGRYFTLLGDVQKNALEQSFKDFVSDYNDLVFSLVTLDNVIEQDP